MHSHNHFGDFEVPRVSERSGTLLFVQVGRGTVTVEIDGAGRILRERSVHWSGRFHHQV